MAVAVRQLPSTTFQCLNSVRRLCAGLVRPGSWHPDETPSGERRRNQLELDKMGTWNSDVLLEIKQEPSLKHGTLIPTISAAHTGVCVHQGRRAYQEDRHLINEKVGADLNLDLLLLAVFDGHAGPECSEYCATNLETFVSRHIALQNRNKEHPGQSREPRVDLMAAVSGAILELNDSFCKYWEENRLDPSFVSPGSTTTVALIRNGYELVVGQVGDSRALLMRGNDSVCLTKEHSASDPQERQRIEDLGGNVSYDEVGRHMINRRLAMSRSIGDLELKKFGVIPEPTIVRRNLKHYKDSSLVLVTDGITFVMSNEEIAHCVNLGETPSESAEKLVDQALLNCCEDNLTALVLPLGAWDKYRADGGKNPLLMIGRSMTLSSRFG